MIEEILLDPVAGAAAREDRIRSELAAVLEQARREQRASYGALAKRSGVPLAEVERIFQRRRGGVVSLYALVRVAEALDVRLQVLLAPLDDAMDDSRERVEAETTELEACMRALNAVVRQNVRLRCELSDLAIHLNAMSQLLRPAWIAERLRVLLDE